MGKQLVRIIVVGLFPHARQLSWGRGGAIKCHNIWECPVIYNLGVRSHWEVSNGEIRKTRKTECEQIHRDAGLESWTVYLSKAFICFFVFCLLFFVFCPPVANSHSNSPPLILEGLLFQVLSLVSPHSILLHSFTNTHILLPEGLSPLSTYNIQRNWSSEKPNDLPKGQILKTVIDKKELRSFNTNIWQLPLSWLDFIICSLPSPPPVSHPTPSRTPLYLTANFWSHFLSRVSYSLAELN